MPAERGPQAIPFGRIWTAVPWLQDGVGQTEHGLDAGPGRDMCGDPQLLAVFPLPPIRRGGRQSDILRTGRWRHHLEPVLFHVPRNPSATCLWNVLRGTPSGRTATSFGRIVARWSPLHCS